MIEVKYLGRLGNNLFQYCFGRILAEKLGYCLKADPIPGFPNTFTPIAGDDYSANYPTQIVTHDYPAVYDGDYSKVLSWKNKNLNLDAIASDKSKRKILVEGYFQRYEYYQPYREMIKNDWLRMDQGANDESVVISPEDIVIHVRLGDFFQHRAVLPFSWYKNLLENILYDKLHLVTDEPGNPYLFQFKKYNPIVHSLPNNTVADFAFIMRFKKIVQSQSAFSWWAAFLSNADIIYSPVPVEGYWSAKEKEINLKVDDPRYYYSACSEVYRPSLQEIFVNKMRAFRRKIKNKLRGMVIRMEGR